jgi:nitrile hydratase
MALAAAGLANTDAFRHAIERLDPVTYLTAGYYGRWLGALELLAQEDDPAVRPTDPAARREVDREPVFVVGDRVRAGRLPVSGHTRLPRYARGQVGTVAIVHPAFVFPDTNAHGRGERPQYVYSVGFSATALWGETAEAATQVNVDLFEDYLEKAE